MSRLAAKRNALGIPLTDLHIHMGAAWLLTSCGRWPTAGVQASGCRLLGVRRVRHDRPRQDPSLDDYLNYFFWSGEDPEFARGSGALRLRESSSKEFRSSHVTRLELRFNPMKRNRGGEQDLDHIIHAALRGLDRVNP